MIPPSEGTVHMRDSRSPADLFNVLGSNAVVSVKTAIDDQVIGDPTSHLGATRLRVPPRTVRVGVRVE